MAKAAAGDGPIRFFTRKGAQVSLPLSAIAIAGDSVQAVTTGLDAARQQALQELFTDAGPWLNYQLKQKQLREAPPGPAAIVTAAVPGSAGNRISLTIKPKTGDTSKVDIEVTMEDAYAGVTLADLGARLDAIPGLVRLTSMADPRVDPVAQKLPAPATTTPPATTTTTTPPATTTTTTTPATTTPTAPTWELKGDADRTSFTLEARRAETARSLVTIEITNVQGDPGARTFTLTAKWTAKAEGVAADAFETGWAPLAFAATAAPPKGGYKLPRPQPDPIRLGGGADGSGGVPATPATATLIANE